MFHHGIPLLLYKNLPEVCRHFFTICLIPRNISHYLTTQLKSHYSFPWPWILNLSDLISSREFLWHFFYSTIVHHVSISICVVGVLPLVWDQLHGLGMNLPKRYNMAIKGQFNNSACFKACIKQKLLSVVFFGRFQLPAGCCAQKMGNWEGWLKAQSTRRCKYLLFWSSSGLVLLHNIGLLWPHTQCAQWHWKVQHVTQCVPSDTSQGEVFLTFYVYIFFLYELLQDISHYKLI